MKKIILFFFLITNVIFGQESNDKIVFLDSLSKETTQENYYFKRVIKDFAIEKSEYKYLDYYKNGKLKSEKTLSGKDGGYPIGEETEYYENGNKKSSSYYENKKLNGTHKFWYENGNLMEERIYFNDNSSINTSYKLINYWNKKGIHTIVDGNGFFDDLSDYFNNKGIYKNGFKDGKWIGKSEKLNFRYEEIHKDGKLISGFSIDKDGVRNEYTELETKPEPIKGMKHFYKFIVKNFKSPDSAFKNKIKGEVIVSFIIDKEGKITEPKIIKSLGEELDNEAIRVLTSYEGWKPAMQKGRKIRCMYSIPIKLDFTR
jgi:TonB family protein